MISDVMALVDWRRQIANLYADIRRSSDPRTAWRLWRNTRDRLFADHPQSPLPVEQRSLFSGIPVFDYQPDLRFDVALETLPQHREQSWDIGQDGNLRVTPFARTLGLGRHLDSELVLYWIGGYGGGLFLPFRDATAADTTYGGGRYLIDAIKGADLGQSAAKLILDFNFAYHPSCRYSPAWTCPLAPPENHLSIPICAGEKL